MKRFYIAVVFLTVMLVACLLLLLHLNKNTLAIKSEIALLRTAAKDENTAAAEAAIKRLTLYWDEEKTLFYALAGSTYCHPFESALSRVTVLLEQNESSEFLTELSELESHIDQLWDTQAPHHKNLF